MRETLRRCQQEAVLNDPAALAARLDAELNRRTVLEKQITHLKNTIKTLQGVNAASVAAGLQNTSGGISRSAVLNAIKKCHPDRRGNEAFSPSEVTDLLTSILGR